MRNLFSGGLSILVNVIKSPCPESPTLNGKLMGLQLCVYMCVCGFSFVISFFLWLIFHRYTNSFFFCGGVLRGTEREKSNKQNDERVREKERESEKESERIIDDFFFLSFFLFYCSLYGIFFIFISFSEFHFFSFLSFFCPSNYIMFYIFFRFFLYYFLDT